MNKTRTLSWIALIALAAIQAAAQPTLENPSASHFLNPNKPGFEWLVPGKTAHTNAVSIRSGGLDTRAWTTVAGWAPGKSAFPDADTCTWQLDLLSVGHEPWR